MDGRFPAPSRCASAAGCSQGSWVSPWSGSRWSSPTTWATGPTGLLRGYKDDPAGESRAAYRSELAALLSAWLASSGAAFAGGGGGPWTVVTGVPSTRRPGRAPVERLIEAVPDLAAGHRRLLGRGTGTLDHLVADRSGFTVAAGVERAWLARQRVLVVDDSTVTGARAQSAAAALRLAGARVAGVLAVGRALPASGPEPRAPATAAASG